MPLLNLKFKIENLKLSSGFTLVELLVVIAILGVLASFTSVTLIGHQKQARDAQRKSDLQQLNKAMQSAKIDCTGGSSYYPSDQTVGFPGLTEGGRYEDGLKPHLSDADLKYLSSAINDPQYSLTGKRYRFARPTPVSSKCPDDAGTPLNWEGVDKYVIRALLEQGKADPDTAKSYNNCLQVISAITISEPAGGFNTTLAPSPTGDFFYVCGD